jgi:hypothetical protein
MNWKNKWVVICSGFLICLMAILFYRGSGSRSLPQSDVSRYGTEEELVVPVTISAVSTEEVSGGAVSGRADSATPRIPSDSDKKNTKVDDKTENDTDVKNTAENDTTVYNTTANNTDEKSSTSDKKSSSKKKNSSKSKSGEKKGATKEPQITEKPSSSPAEVTAAATPSPTPAAESWQVTFQIQCKEILNKKELWKSGIEEIIPENGVFYTGSCSYSEGDTVYDLLKRICTENQIALDSQYTPIYGTYYIRGIGNLYEFDCGDESGWKYSVNGVLPSVGCSGYSLKNGDDVVFYYDYKY